MTSSARYVGHGQPKPGEVAGASSTALEERRVRKARSLLEGAGPLASGGIDMHPLAGPAKALVEFGTEHDLVTGERGHRKVCS